MARKDAHVVYGVKEHFWIAPAKPENGGERVAQRDGTDPA
jgi:hypothetical protein